MTALALTARQEEILDFVRLFHEEHGYAPTRQEIADAFEFSSANAAEQHLKALASKGALRLVPGISRGIVSPPPAVSSSTPSHKGKRY